MWGYSGRIDAAVWSNTGEIVYCQFISNKQVAMYNVRGLYEFWYKSTCQVTFQILPWGSHLKKFQRIKETHSNWLSAIKFWKLAAICGILLQFVFYDLIIYWERLVVCRFPYWAEARLRAVINETNKRFIQETYTRSRIRHKSYELKRY